MLENKTNNEILLIIKEIEMEHNALKISLIKDYDAIECLRDKMKKGVAKLSEIESRFNNANKIIVKRLKGNI